MVEQLWGYHLLNGAFSYGCCLINIKCVFIYVLEDMVARSQKVFQNVNRQAWWLEWALNASSTMISISVLFLQFGSLSTSSTMISATLSISSAFQDIVW